MASAAPAPAPLAMPYGMVLIAGLVLAFSNFMVVLDMTIANVSVPHIAGSLGISSSEGTWVITSYAVAEAVCVPLTGWLARRFGEVRVFVAGMIGFGVFSFLCGVAPSLGALVAFRIGQGLSGGPLMPLTQALLLRIYLWQLEGTPVTVSMLSRSLGVSRATCRRKLATLIEWEFIKREGQTYRIVIWMGEVDQRRMLNRITAILSHATTEMALAKLATSVAH